MITGSAMRKLEAQTGLEVKRLSPTCYGLYITSSVALYSFVADEKKACQQLRDQNWARVSRLAFEKAGWKCERCHRIRECQGHHKIHRSLWSRDDGPLDVVENLECLCAQCHESEHRPVPLMGEVGIIEDLNEIDRIIESAESENGLDC